MYIHITIRLPTVTYKAIKTAAGRSPIKHTVSGVLFEAAAQAEENHGFQQSVVEGGLPSTNMALSFDLDYDALVFVKSLEKMTKQSNCSRAKLVASLLVAHFTPEHATFTGRVKYDAA